MYNLGNKPWRLSPLPPAGDFCYQAKKCRRSPVLRLASTAIHTHNNFNASAPASYSPTGRPANRPQRVPLLLNTL